METPNMSKPLFEFVKVAAGTAFPFETGTFYSHFDDTPKEFWMSRIVKGSVHHKDMYILRPAESPDAGREGNKLKEIAKVAGNYDPKYSYLVLKNIELFAKGDIKHMDDLPSLDVPAANVGDIPVGREHPHTALLKSLLKCAEGNHVITGKPRENVSAHMLKHEIKKALAEYPTPADPGSQVEAGKFAEWTSDEQWEYQPHAKLWVKYELVKQSDGMYESKIYAEATTADLIILYKQSL